MLCNVHNSRIKHAHDAVTLATGGPRDTHNIDADDQIFDRHADGAPIVLEAHVAEAAQTATPERKIETKNNQRAQIWSFRPVAELPLADGTYQIANNRTGTVLSIAANAPLATAVFDANHANNTVQSRESQANQTNQKWIVEKDADGDSYTFKNSRPGDHDRFLGTRDNGAPEAGRALHARGDAQKKKFTIRKVPDTNFYKIFSVPNDHHVSPWAVNLGALDHGVYPVALHADEAEKWSFV
ncbi:hypothetical protein K443DRAFT_269505 [Laccaria amethystina LaAM-08-1]|uniref:Unplaced genomic scaffold K443scaffold_171, whole genome shotgun sequence n=1 Tax=Laccaria amethystina LaAM-08-1 TaxID=1095629 RepID=A0A0C9WWF8_9AGAR|nr:hypothetical protein K443DRAFT_269505 [Laccaria amethystina LaAM-08-1]